MRLLFAVLLAGCAANTDPWPGVYVGEVTTNATDCDTGDAYAPDVQSIDITIERDGSALVIAGRCLIRLNDTSSRNASIVPLVCNYAADDGTAVTQTVVSGRAQLNGDALDVEYSSQVEAGGVCLTALSRFEGRRVE